MKKLVDVHVHIAAFPDGNNGCHMAPSYQKGILSRYMIWKLGLKGKNNLELNRSYVEKLLSDLKASKSVGKAVILALDGIYDEKGELDLKETKMMVGNDYILGLAHENPEYFIPGASVNPQRKDALDELSRVIEKGARLIKVLPNCQDFDPQNKKYLPFYRMLREKKIPLLTHMGYEFSIPAVNQKFGRLPKWQLALEEGVRLIAAHLASSGLFIPGKWFRIFSDFMGRFPTLYTDLSGITPPDRILTLLKLRGRPDLFPRLLFGTDYPISVFASSILGAVDPRTQIDLWKIRNPFDKMARILEALKINFNPSLTEKLLNI